MAHFVGIKSSIAGWAAGTAITQGNMWQIDSDLAKAINGDDGGAWSPSAAITIGGSGLTVDGAVFTITATGSIACAGVATFTGNVNLGNSISADTVTVTAAQTYYGAETHNGAVALLGAVTANGTITSNNTLTANGNVQIGDSGSDTLTVTSASTFNGTEYHNGQEEHAGVVYFNGDTVAGAGHDCSGFESVSSAADLTRAIDSPNLMIVSMTVGGNAVRMSATTGITTIGGAKKTIRCAIGSAYGFQVVDTYSGQQIANLAAGGEVTIICDANRWY